MQNYPFRINNVQAKFTSENVSLRVQVFPVKVTCQSVNRLVAEIFPVKVTCQSVNRLVAEMISYVFNYFHVLRMCSSPLHSNRLKQPDFLPFIRFEKSWIPHCYLRDICLEQLIMNCISYRIQSFYSFTVQAVRANRDFS